MIIASASTSTIGEMKATLREKLLYNAKWSTEADALVESLLALSDAPADTMIPDGRYTLLSSGEFATTLRRATPRFDTPLLPGAPVVAHIDGEELQVEAEMLVVGCATGLRLRGTITPDGRTLGVELQAGEFFEPSEEFGISKALKKCEEVLRPKLPTADAPLSATLEMMHLDDEWVVLRTEAVANDDAPPLMFVLERITAPEKSTDDLMDKYW